MHFDADGLPVVGDAATKLGVRFPPNSPSDVDVCESTDDVLANGKGMSIAPHWRALPVHRIPIRLQPRFPAAIGSNRYRCYRLGAIRFENCEVSQLLVHFAGRSHGTICPKVSMAKDQFRVALSATRTDWEVDEE